MTKNYRAKKDVETRIHRLCMMAGTNEMEMERLGSDLLQLFHDVCRYNKEAAEDMTADLCYEPDLCFTKEDCAEDMSRAVTRLEVFVSDSRKDKYEREIEVIQQTAGILRVMDALKYWVYSFGKYGPEYLDILNTRYMSKFDYTNAEASEVLSMGESTYYRKKKMAEILFGLAFLEYKATFAGDDFPGSLCPDGVQISMAI